MKAKKLLSLLLACCLAAVIFAGCGNGNRVEDDSTATGSSAATDSLAASADTAIEMPSFKIGIISHTNSGGCWERILDSAEYLGSELNCEVVTAVGSNADQILTEAENFIAAGVDGIITTNDGGVTARLADLCEDAGVYLVFSDCGYNVISEDDYSSYATDEYYVGHVAHDEYADSYACVEDMIEKGAENFVIFGLPPGISANFDQRAVGAMDAITDAGLAYVEARSFAMAEIANNLMSQYPNTDAIFSFVTTPESFNVPDMASKYGGQIQISAYMVGDVSYEFEVGFLTHVSVGSEARMELAFALLYNAMRGDRISNADGAPAEILFPHLWITSGEDFGKFYAAATGGNHVYDIDEIKQLIKAFNPDVSVDDYQTVADDFSAEGGWLASK